MNLSNVAEDIEQRAVKKAAEIVQLIVHGDGEPCAVAIVGADDEVTHTLDRALAREVARRLIELGAELRDPVFDIATRVRLRAVE